MEKSWYGEESDGQIMSIETYYGMCKEFAAAMGFCESTIEEQPPFRINNNNHIPEKFAIIAQTQIKYK